jgi:DNA-binding LacI/PurR family transcriptional regulator
MRAAETGVPHIAFETPLPGIKRLNSLAPDDELAAAQSVQAMIQAGKQKLGFISSALQKKEINSASRRRLKGFLSEAQALGATIQDEWVLTFFPDVSPPPEDISYMDSAVKEFVNSPRRPEAVLLASYNVAALFLRVCEESNVRIPEDIAVITISGSVLERKIPNLDDVKKLTSFYYEESEMASMGVELLNRWVHDPTFRPGENQLPFKFNPGYSLRCSFMSTEIKEA